MPESTAPETPPADGSSPAANTATVGYPFVFQNVDYSQMNLPDGQAEGIKTTVAQLQQEFNDAIGDPNQDPADPAYLAKWQQAVRENNDQLGLALGNRLYMQFQGAVQK
jgi:hypothetical protein